MTNPAQLGDAISLPAGKNMDLCVLALVQDISPTVRQAAIRLLNHIGHGPVAV